MRVCVNCGELRDVVTLTMVEGGPLSGEKEEK